MRRRLAPFNLGWHKYRCDMKRRDEILTAVDALVAAHDEWAEDDSAPDVPTREFEVLIDDVVDVCKTGSVPGDCRELVEAVDKLGTEWQAYSEGAWDNKGQPMPQFWRSFRGVLAARAGAYIPKPVPPTPVSILVEEGGTSRQIAHAIYGWREDGVRMGPFIDPDNGAILENLIRQEAEKPGSVIPEGWIKPTALRDAEKMKEEAANRITEVEEREVVAPKPTVESMLRDGAYVQQTSRVTGVGEDKVRQIAEILGLDAIEQENPTGAVRAPQEPQLTESDHLSLQAKNAGPIDDDYEEDDDIADIDPVDMSDDQIADMIVRMSDGGESSTDIAKGLGITVQKAAQVIRRHKEKAQGEVSDG